MYHSQKRGIYRKQQLLLRECYLLFVVCMCLLFVVCICLLICCWCVIEVCCCNHSSKWSSAFNKKTPLARSHPSAFQPWHVRFLWWNKCEKHQHVPTLLSWLMSRTSEKLGYATVDGSEIRPTTRDVWNPLNSGIIIILGGAGFQPSTVVQGRES